MSYLMNYLLLRARSSNFFKTVMVFIEESGEVEHLPTVLASEVVGQSLQFVEHDIFDVVVVENRVKQKAVLVLSSIHHAYLPASLVK